jgi:hypothetical protein
VQAKAPATIVYDDTVTHIDDVSAAGSELWVRPADLARATGFELKPEGVCRDHLCFPIPANEAANIVRGGLSDAWFNLTAFARLTDQPVAHDEAHATWYFGSRSDQRAGLASLQAPDFTLPDVDGRAHTLSALRGTKVLLVTWASW